MNPAMLSIASHLGVSAGAPTSKPTAPAGSGSRSAPKPKKRPGRGKPGASHLAQLTQAHGQGSYQQAKIHALNYANAVDKHLKSGGGAISDPSAMSQPDNDADDQGMAAPAAPTAQNAPPAGPSGASRLAMMMRGRR